MKTKNIFSLAVLAVTLTACSSESDMTSVESPSQKGKIVTLTATISQGNASTRTLTDNNDGTISSAWEVGTETITQVDGDGKATITAELTDPENDTSVDFQYPYGYSGGQLFSEQKGTLELINQKFDSQGGGGRLIVNGDKATLPNNVHIEHHNCILKLNFSDGIKDITKDVVGLGIVYMDKSNNQRNLRLNNISSQNTIYVALEPQIDYSTNPYTLMPTEYHIHIDLNNDEHYTYSQRDITLDKGKMYTSSLKMNKEIRFEVFRKENNSWITRGNSQFAVLNDYVSDQGGELPGGLYVLTSPLKFSGTIKFTGNTELVLCDNINLSNSENCSAKIDASGYELSIYAQRTKNDIDNNIYMGGINLECSDGIALQAQNLNIHGGAISLMTTADGYAGISAGNINVYGGEFRSNSYGLNNKAIGIRFSGSFDIYGGQVGARGGAGGIQYVGEGQSSGLTVYGGRIDVTCETEGHGITAHSVTVNGGSLTTTGGSANEVGENNFTGVGDGMNCGVITVNGGNLTAWGGNNNYSNNSSPGGYGIGGGTIYVNGGELHANGGNAATPGKGIVENETPIVGNGLNIYEGSDQQNMSQFTGSEFKCTTQYIVIK